LSLFQLSVDDDEEGEDGENEVEGEDGENEVEGEESLPDIQLAVDTANDREQNIKPLDEAIEEAVSAAYKYVLL